MIIFSSRLREARKKAGYSGPQLAALIGVKYNTYIRYETQNGEPRQETLVKISQVLGVSIDWLLGNQREEQKDISPLLQTVKKMLSRSNTVYDSLPIDKETRWHLLKLINDIDTAARGSTLAYAVEYFEQQEQEERKENGEK